MPLTQALRIGLALLLAISSLGAATDEPTPEYRAAFARVYNVVVTARTVRDYFNERQSENVEANQKAYEAWLKSHRLSDAERRVRKTLSKSELRLLEERAQSQRPALFKMFDTLGPRLTTYEKFLEQTDTFHLTKKLPDDMKLISPAPAPIE